MRHQAKVAGRAHSAAAARKPPSFKSNFAILDVTTGRDALLKRISKGEKVLVRVDLEIDAISSRDDGVSREFSCNVRGLKQL
jgi:hypothetical protein